MRMRLVAVGLGRLEDGRGVPHEGVGVVGVGGRVVAPVGAQVSGQRKNFDQSFVPRRCSTLRLRLRGEGQITLRSLARTIASARGGILEQEV